MDSCLITVLVNFPTNFQTCRMLKKIDLEDCVLITDATLNHLASGCPRLEKLVSISNNYQVEMKF